MLSFLSPLPARSVFSSYILYVIAVKKQKNYYYTVLPSLSQWSLVFLSSPYRLCTADKRFRFIVVYFTVFVVNNFTAVQIEYTLYSSTATVLVWISINSLFAILSRATVLRYGSSSSITSVTEVVVLALCWGSGSYEIVARPECDFYRKSFSTWWEKGGVRKWPSSQSSWTGETPPLAVHTKPDPKVQGRRKRSYNKINEHRNACNSALKS